MQDEQPSSMRQPLAPWHGKHARSRRVPVDRGRNVPLLVQRIAEVGIARTRQTSADGPGARALGQPPSSRPGDGVGL